MQAVSLAQELVACGERWSAEKWLFYLREILSASSPQAAAVVGAQKADVLVLGKIKPEYSPTWLWT